MISLLMRYEVIYWLVAVITSIFSFSLPGLLLLAIGNIFIRDILSFLRGLTVLWLVAAVSPLLGPAGVLEKVIGTLGTGAALVIYALIYSRTSRPCKSGLLPAVHNGAVLAVALFMLWTDKKLFGPFWIPAVIFLCLALYSLLFQKEEDIT